MLPGLMAQLGRPAARRLHGDLRVEVDVCHHGKGRLLADALEGVEAIAARDGHADHLASRRGEFPNLRKVGVRVVCGRIQHGLHHHGAPPPKGTVPTITRCVSWLGFLSLVVASFLHMDSILAAPARLWETAARKAQATREGRGRRK